MGSLTEWQQGSIYKQFGEIVTTMVDRQLKSEERMDELLKEAKGELAQAGHLHSPEAEALKERLLEAGTLETFKGGSKAGVGVGDLIRKADTRQMRHKATMTTGANLTGRVIAPDRRGAMRPPAQLTHIRPFLARDTTTSNTISFVQETGFTSNVAGVPEGQVKPESDLDFEEKLESAETIADTIRVTRQMLDDVDFLSAYITSRMSEALRKEEDRQILYGNGTVGELTGITTHALSAFDKTTLQAAISAGEVKFANRIDVLRFAILQARKANFEVDTVLLAPEDMAIIDSLKDEDGRYLDEMQRLRVAFGESNSVAEDNFIVGSMGTGGVVMLLDRQEPTLEFFEQDRDNVPRNLVTVRIEERIVAPVFRPEGIVTGTFTDALTAE